MNPIHIDDPRASIAADTGTKAATLAALRRSGYNVPEAWVIPTAMTAAIAESRDIAKAPVEEILSQLGMGPVAVRSSAAAEDMPGASVAGMYETFLNVSGVEEVVDAVYACVAAGQTERLTAYRGDGAAPPPAVLIQRMVAADRAGVAFSVDPVTGDDTIRVSAVHGLGDQLVGGVADPEDWSVDKTTLKAERTSTVTVLESSEAAEVAQLAAGLEARLGSPQDIEWALEDGTLYLLQSRPITIVPTAPQERLEGTGWEKDTTHFPEQLTPFGASTYVAPLAESSSQAMCATYGLVAKEIEFRAIGGEPYIRIVPLVGPADSKGRRAPPAWLLGMLARLVPAMRRANRRAQMAIDSGALDNVFDRWDDEWRPERETEGDRLLAIDPAALDDEELIEYLADLQQHLLRGFTIHFELFVPYGVALSELDETCRTMLGWSTGQTMNLLVGLSRASVKGRDDLAEIAQAIHADPSSLAAIDHRPDEPVAALLGTNADLVAKLEAWFAIHGMRCFNYDAGSPTLGERPGVVTRMIIDGVEPSPDGAEVRTAAEEDARSRLSDRELESFEELLVKAQRAYPNREENVIYADNIPSGLLRRWVVEAGRRLSKRGVISRRDDIVFLEVDEIVAALRGVATNDLAATIVGRTSEYAWVRAHPGPDFVGERDEMPDISALPPAMRRTNSALLWLAGQEYPAERVATPTDAIVAGNPASGGTITGAARIVLGEADFHKVRPGDVMVSPITTPAWTMLFSIAGAVVTNGGGVLSHAAIVAREHGIPPSSAPPGRLRPSRTGRGSQWTAQQAASMPPEAVGEAGLGAVHARRRCRGGS